MINLLDYILPDGIKYTSPIAHKDYTDFPPTYIEIAEFDSLKDDYSGFTEWFVKKQIDDAKAYVTFNQKRITSFLMLKKEDEKED